MVISEEVFEQRYMGRRVFFPAPKWIVGSCALCGEHIGDEHRRGAFEYQCDRFFRYSMICLDCCRLLGIGD